MWFFFTHRIKLTEKNDTFWFCVWKKKIIRLKFPLVIWPTRWLTRTKRAVRVCHLLLSAIEGLLDPFGQESSSSLQVRTRLVLCHRLRCAPRLRLPLSWLHAGEFQVGGGGGATGAKTRSVSGEEEEEEAWEDAPLLRCSSSAACSDLLLVRGSSVEESSSRSPEGYDDNHRAIPESGADPQTRKTAREEGCPDLLQRKHKRNSFSFD